MTLGTMTLAQIRAAHPYEDVWEKLKAYCGGASTPLDTVVSLGDIARSSGAADAWWCARCLDWSDMATCRAVIGALLPALSRAAAHTTDGGVRARIDAVSRWQAGDYRVDLLAEKAAAAMAWAAREAPEAAWATERESQAADLIAAFPPLVERADA